VRLVDEFRDARLAESIRADLEYLSTKAGADETNPLQIMEICGGHTHTIFRHGIDKLVPRSIEFVHGPGCPVCVLPMQRVDEFIELAERDSVILTSYGDAMRVPGRKGSLQQCKAAGVDVRMVYSPSDSLEIARKNPNKQVVFFGLGFETTAPATAISILQAAKEDISNFSVFCNHITVPPPIRSILEQADVSIDGFIGPGHVSMVIGTKPYDFIAGEFGKPVVVAGFEPLDLMQSVLMLLRQIVDGSAMVENQYSRVVTREGNPVSLSALNEVFETRPSFEWRGLGEIESSGLRIRKRFAQFDAEERFGIGYGSCVAREGSRDQYPCGKVMVGKLKPFDCPHFCKDCTPENPLGALMVSSEGACAAYHQYGGFQ
jgi:hydrogenase expression/formation protein HypD